jgi:type II secretory pathway pseudopilin PulG
MKLYLTKSRVLVFIVALLAVLMAGIYCSAVTGWRKAVTDADETALRRQLREMRGAIQSYAIKRHALPQTLSDLGAEGESVTVPDPMTGRADWQVLIGEDPALVKDKRGVINVHSASAKISSEGTPYNSW